MTPYYERNGITIYVGDCLEIMPQLDMVFDSIICDLPYGKTELTWDKVISFAPLWMNYKRLVKGNGAVVLFGTQPFSSKLVMSNLEWFRYEDIWQKTQARGHLQAYKIPLREHENILVFSKKGRVFNPQFSQKPKENIRPVSGRTKSQMFERGKLEKLERHISGDLSFPKSIVKFANVNGKENVDHPTQKPLALMVYLIRTYTNPSEIILDNTMGSGTTLVAAQNEGRRAAGIELSEDYCKIAVERLRQPSFFSIPDKPKSERPEQLSLKDV